MEEKMQERQRMGISYRSNCVKEMNGSEKEEDWKEECMKG